MSADPSAPKALPSSNPWGVAFRLLRIPFSAFLMPIYWFALTQVGTATPAEDWGWTLALRAAGVFAVLHLLVYPASNGYNSYFDRDEGPIGGLASPPPVPPQLWPLVLVFDALGLLGALALGWPFAVGVVVYMAVSKAYSWPGIRLKRYPVASTVAVTVFQGGFTYLVVLVGVLGWPQAWALMAQLPTWVYALTATLFLLGSYPLTQIYQHAEDAARGDRTLSLLLGHRGSMLWAGAAFALATGLMGATFWANGRGMDLLIFLLAMAPVLAVFNGWALRVWRNPQAADYRSAMRMNAVSSLCLSGAFVAMLLRQALGV